MPTQPLCDVIAIVCEQSADDLCSFVVSDLEIYLPLEMKLFTFTQLLLLFFVFQNLTSVWRYTFIGG